MPLYDWANGGYIDSFFFLGGGGGGGGEVSVVLVLWELVLF